MFVSRCSDTTVEVLHVGLRSGIKEHQEKCVCYSFVFAEWRCIFFMNFYFIFFSRILVVNFESPTVRSKIRMLFLY